MNTRVIVKYLPRECDENLLKKHFSSCGFITDCRIMRTPSGKSRQFGFVGFSDDASKDRAMKLNLSYIRTCQIVVEEALPFKSKELPRAWSKYTRGTSGFKNRESKLKVVRENRKQKKEKQKQARLKKKEEEKKQKESELENFLENKQQLKTIWENDDIEIPTNMNPEHDEDEDDDESSSDSDDEGEKDMGMFPPPRIGPTHQSSLSDLDWLKSKTEEKDNSETTAGEKENEEESVVKEPVLEDGRLFVRNLSYSVKDEHLEKLFSKFGDLSEVYYPVDITHKQPKGYAFITFVVPSNAEKAMNELNRKYFHGRILHVIPGYESKRKNEHVEKAVSKIKSSYKKTLKTRQKMTAGSAFNWNTLYVRPDAAVAGIAKELGVTQSSVTGVGEDDGGAVRVALAETQILQEIRKTLDEMGISVDDVFKSEREKVRSNTMILVKNLSEGTKEEELRVLFSQYGEVRQVKMVTSTGTFAIIRFFGRNDALRAFQNLSYHQFNGKPLFLEWAPMKQEKEDKVEKIGGIVTLQKIKKNGKDVEKRDEEMDSSEEEEEEKTKEVENNTLYVKNLNFKTTDHNLSEFLKKITQYKIKTTNCRIVKDKFGYSLGYGFVSFRTTNEAIETRRKVNGKVLMGHQLVVSFSRLEDSKKKENITGTISSSSTMERKRSKLKLIVKNLAFEATRKDLFKLFGTFGEIKEIRIPRKLSGGHRGFAFVEFVSEEECSVAMNALKNSHLYGRSLVLEFAIEDESVENLRESVRSNILKKRKRNEQIQSDGKIHFKKNVKRRRIEGK